MLYGSLLAGIAFGNSGVSAAHALQFAVGAATHTSHGLGTGLLLPYCMEFNRPARERGAGRARADASAPSRSAFVHELGRRIGLPASLAEIGVAREDLRGDGRGVGRHQAADRQQPAPARRGRRSSASSRPPGRAGSARWLREVADRALEVRGHARDGSVDVAALDHVEQLAVLARPSPSAPPRPGAAARCRAGSRRSSRGRAAPAAGCRRRARARGGSRGRPRRPRSSASPRSARRGGRSRRGPRRAARRARAPGARSGTRSGSGR